MSLLVAAFGTLPDAWAGTLSARGMDGLESMLMPAGPERPDSGARRVGVAADRVGPSTPSLDKGAVAEVAESTMPEVEMV